MRYVTTLILLWGTILSTWAQTFVDGGIRFEILDEAAKTAKVIAANNPEDYAGNLHIPETATLTTNEGSDETTVSYAVTTIATGAFADCAKLLSITLPASITTVERNAITNCPNLYTVTLGAGLTQVTNLGSPMFAGCTSLSHLNYMGESKDVLRKIKSLSEEQRLAPVIHCQPSLSDVKFIRPFDHISMTKNDSYKQDAYASFVTYLPLDFADTGLRASIATSLPTKDNNTITYRYVTKVPAGTAIFVQGNDEAYDRDIVARVITDPSEIAEAEEQVKDNKLQGSTTDVYVLKPVEEEKLYAISKSSNTLRYINPVTIPYLRSNVTYYPVSQGDVPSVSELFLVPEAGTGSDSTDSLPTLTTTNSSHTYDLTGRPLQGKNQGRHSLIITQGKKLLNP